MNTRNLTWILIVCCLLIQPHSANAKKFPSGLDWKQIETDHFVIIYDEHLREAALHVAGIAEPIHQDVTEFLRHTPGSKTYIVLTDHVDYSNGYASPLPQNTIVLYLREPGAGGPFFALGAPDWLSLVLTHEYTHIVHIDMADGLWGLIRKVFGRVSFPNISLPMWMIEGLAVYTETKWQNGRGHQPEYEMMIRTAIVEGHFKRLDQMAAIGLRTWPMGTVYYLYGYFFYQFLAETYGEETLVKMNRLNSKKLPIFGGDIFEKTYDDKDVKTLWKEWREAMRERYNEQLEAIRAEPVTESTPLSATGYYTTSPLFSPDGRYVYYVEMGRENYAPTLVLYDLTSRERLHLTEGISGAFTLSADGRTIYFSKIDVYQTFFEYSDLYELDVSSREVRRLTRGRRAADPAISPDGNTLVFTTTEAGMMSLMRMNLETGTVTPIFEPDDHTQFAHPVFSSDGTRIAVQIWKKGGYQDVYVMNRDGSGLTALTFDRATDSSPVWGPKDEYIFFGSDRTGIPNIFACELDTKTLYQMTNVLTGAFNPSVNQDGTKLVFEHYSSRGMDIHLTDLNLEAGKDWNIPLPPLKGGMTPGGQTAQKILPQAPKSPLEGGQGGVPIDENERKYSPFPSVLPAFWLPSWEVDEEGYKLGIMTSGQDVLRQHRYLLYGEYGIENERMGWIAQYTNEQFYPTITLFGSDRADVAPDTFRDADDEEVDYWQREQMGGIEIGVPLYVSRNTELSLTTGYRYKQLESLEEDVSGWQPVPDEGTLSGISAGLRLQHLKSSIYAISPEAGITSEVTYRHDDEELGSDFTLDTVVGDSRLYLSNPAFSHHVLAFRAVGGMSDGDTLSQGIFRLGGTWIESRMASLNEQSFFLRGYEDDAFYGNRFALGSVEYRFPFWYPQRGIGNGWFFFDSLVGVVFYDIGNAWDGETEFEDFKHGVGGEFRLNFGLQYGALPLTARLGYAHGLDDDLGESQLIATVTLDLWL